MSTDFILRESILIKKLSTAVYLIIPLLFAILSNQIFSRKWSDVIEGLIPLSY